MSNSSYAKQFKIDPALMEQLRTAFTEANVPKKDTTTDDVEEITRGMSNLTLLEPIKVVIIPFAHGGIKSSSKQNQELVHGMDVKLISATSGTCTMQSQQSYLEVLLRIVNSVKYENYIRDPNYENKLIEFLNFYQNQVVNSMVSTKPIYIPELRKDLHELPTTLASEGYVKVLSDTYSMTIFNDTVTSTKYYEPIPDGDPIRDSLETVAQFMNIDPNEYNTKPFIIYMYLDRYNNFNIGITQNTYKYITINEVLFNVNRSITCAMDTKNIKLQYIFADPNCSYGDYTLKFGGKSPKKNRKFTKHNTNKKNKKKSRKYKNPKG